MAFRVAVKTGFLLSTAAISQMAEAATIPRTQPLAGKIVSAKGGEQAVLAPDPRLHPAEARQDLKAGDILRTNAQGTLAIVFADQTQIRLGRNSVLLVKAVANGSPSALRLETGAIWARSARGKTRLSVETPSATAAIRGTEWSLIAGEAQTTLQVFSGEIAFFNDQGSLLVSAGQAAVAQLGKAPSRIVIVNSREREQMLYYFPIDVAFTIFSPSPLRSPDARSEAQRIMAIPDSVRDAEDWLILAETGLGRKRRADVRAALEHARAMELSAAQRARIDLIDGWLAADAKEWSKAIAHIDSGLPQLTGHRAATARFLRLIAAVRENPDIAATIQPPPFVPDEPASYMAEIFLAAYAGDTNRALTITDQAIARFPDDPEMRSIKGQLGMLLGDKAMIEESVRQTLVIDPEHPEALRLRALLRTAYRGDPEGGIEDARRATEIAPANAIYWSAYGEALSERGAMREAEQAMRKGIEEEPDDPLIRTNHAIILMDQNRLADAKAEIDKALALDPNMSIAHALLGRHAMQDGDYDSALSELLASSAADPAYAEGLLMLAAVYYRRGEYAVALQQIDAADRLDPASATPALFRAAIAIDRYDLDTAVMSAREALRRYRAKGGIYASLSENRGTGSYVAGAFRFLDLDDWGRYYGDRVFDSFTANAYFDQVNSSASQPFLIEQSAVPFDPRSGQSDQFSSLLQGVALQPLSIASSERNLQLFRERFVELSGSGTVIAANGDIRGAASAAAQGLTFEPVPVAINISATKSASHGPIGENNDAWNKSVTALIGMEITPYDRLVILGQVAEDTHEFPGTLSDPGLSSSGQQRGITKAVYGVYAHEFGYRNILTLGGSVAGARLHFRRQDELLFQDPIAGIVPVLAMTGIEHQADTWSAGGNWAVGIKDIDVRIGLEAFGRKDRQSQQLLLRSPFGEDGLETSGRASTEQQRYYFNFRAQPARNLTIEGQVAATDAGQTKADWKLGVAVEPREGQWLRGAYMRETAGLSPFTLAPTRVAGLIANVAPVPPGRRLESSVVRWDAEWSPHFFTAVEYQHQEFSALSFARPNIIAPFGVSATLGPANFDFGSADLDRLTVSGNLWMKGNIGLNALYARSWSNLDAERAAIPFLPSNYARAGVSWTHPIRLKLSASLSYIDDRRSELLVTRLDDHVSVDASLNWQSPGKRFQIDVSANNLLDDDHELITDVPGWGRTLQATLTVRL